MTETAKGPVDVVALTRGQQAAVRRVAEARATVPHISVGTEVDAPAGDDALPALVHAAARALRDHPAVNGAYRDGRLERYGRVNVAVVVAGLEGPLSPVVFDADAKAREDVADEVAALTARAAAGELTAPELAGATFVVQASAAHRVEPVVPPGLAAVLGAGAAEVRPAVRAGAVVALPRIDLTLACDARAVTASDAAAFLHSVAGHLGG